MKNTQKSLFTVSFILSTLFSFLFILAANIKNGVEKFDIYLGAVWVFVLAFIITLSLAHKLNENK